MQLKFDPAILIKRRVAIELVNTGLVTGAVVEAIDERNLVLKLLLVDKDRVIGQDRGSVKYFRSLDACADYLSRIGIFGFSVDTVQWRPQYVISNQARMDRRRAAIEAAGQPVVRRTRVTKKELAMTG